MGEGEGVAEWVVRTIDDSSSRAIALATLAEHPNVFVPEHHGDQLAKIAACDDAMLPATSTIVTPHTELSNMFLLEAERGCSRGCTYCVMRRSTNGGMRIVPEDVVLAAIPHEYKRVGLVARPQRPPAITNIFTRRRSRCEVGLSSLRPDKLKDEFVAALRRAGYRTLTTALDGPSERMRNLIERRGREPHYQVAAENARRHGYDRLKLYLMVGLPGEADEDIDECVRFVSELSKIVPIALGVAPFCAKRNTPLDRMPYAGIRTVEARLDRLRRGLRGRADVRSVSAKWAWVEYVLAQGGVPEALAFYRAVKSGGHFAAYRKEFLALGHSPDGRGYAGSSADRGGARRPEFALVPFLMAFGLPNRSPIAELRAPSFLARPAHRRLALQCYVRMRRGWYGVVAALSAASVNRDDRAAVPRGHLTAAWRRLVGRRRRHSATQPYRNAPAGRRCQGPCQGGTHATSSVAALRVAALRPTSARRGSGAGVEVAPPARSCEGTASQMSREVGFTPRLETSSALRACFRAARRQSHFSFQRRRRLRAVSARSAPRSGCIVNDYFYFQTGPSCQVEMVGEHHRGGDGCIPADQPPRWGIPGPPPPSELCDADLSAREISGQYLLPVCGFITACRTTSEKPDQRPLSGSITLLIAQNPNDLSRASVTFTRTGDPALDEQTFEATVERATLASQSFSRQTECGDLVAHFAYDFEAGVSDIHVNAVDQRLQRAPGGILQEDIEPSRSPSCSRITTLGLSPGDVRHCVVTTSRIFEQGCTRRPRRRVGVEDRSGSVELDSA